MAEKAKSGPSFGVVLAIILILVGGLFAYRYTDTQISHTGILVVIGIALAILRPKAWKLYGLVFVAAFLYPLWSPFVT